MRSKGSTAYRRKAPTRPSSSLSPTCAETLRVPLGHPLILVERIVYLANGQPAYSSRAYYRADSVQFRRRIQRGRADKVIRAAAE
nr:UTRA domain-containing protein [Starkeya sp. ORNL1]